ncbi:MAG: uracil-DNA glycosylase [Eubacteriales bacterium]
MTIKINNDWNDIVQNEFRQEYYIRLRSLLKKEYGRFTVYPDKYDIFNAFHFTSYADTKVVILGQDPYHGDGQAHGLSFSVKDHISIPPSLINIYKELKDDLGYPIPEHGYLKKWADQGVFLLNAVLTVRAGLAASHRDIGWKNFTDHVISTLNRKEDPIVFILWGKFAQSKKTLIDNPMHYIIQSPHPSPLSASRGFFGSKPFSKTNAFLQSVGKEPVDWRIE